MVRAITWVLLVAACGGGKNNPDPDAADIPDDAPDIDAPPDADPLATLQGTGLCMDAGCMQIDSSAIEYRPKFELWADGATKRRWIRIPAGTKIDTTNMDRWVFPVGTELWKEFSRDGTRVETRYITKRNADDDAPAAWFFVSYAWNADQNATTATAMGQANANGTMHDIPSRAQCKDCHDSLVPSRVLGFQAIQLDFESNLLDLEDLIAMDLLTAPPTAGTPGNRFPILPAATQVERDAFGYLHGNCGHCHNATSPNHDVTPLELLLDTTKLATVAETPTFLTTVGVTGMTIVENGTPYSTIVIPDDPANSILIVRMNATGTRRMPKIASEVTDPAGQAALLAWINNL